ncbi:hypothetical protein [Blastococcus sp. SYSU DS0533]
MSVSRDGFQGTGSQLTERAVTKDFLGRVAALLAPLVFAPGAPALVGVEVKGEHDVRAVGDELDAEVATARETTLPPVASAALSISCK